MLRARRNVDKTCVEWEIVQTFRILTLCFLVEVCLRF